jgi:hypothetical protein
MKKSVTGWKKEEKSLTGSRKGTRKPVTGWEKGTGEICYGMEKGNLRNLLQGVKREMEKSITGR